MKEDKSKYEKFRVKTKYKCPKCNSTWELVERLNPLCPICDIKFKRWQETTDKLGIHELTDN